MFDPMLFFGRFHPVLTHLPIGFLLLALIYKSIGLYTQKTQYQSAFVFTLGLTVISAFMACITGWLLSTSSSYPTEDISKHRWSGIFLTGLITIWYLKESGYWGSRFGNKYLEYGIVVILFLGLTLTGHWGGVLTHGSNYLMQGLPQAWQSWLNGSQEIEPLTYDIDTLEKAVFYTDIVQPMLEVRCYSCHGARKQKGDLRLDSKVFIQAGGESGRILHPDTGQSMFYKRLHMPLDHEDHMPPKDKTQFTTAQLSVLSAWLLTGGDFEIRIEDLADQSEVKNWYASEIALARMYEHPLVPSNKVNKSDQQQVQEIKNKGILIHEIGENSHFLEISFLNKNTITYEDIQALMELKSQIIWLDLSGHELSDAVLEALGQLTNITKVNISNTKWSSVGIQFLKTWTNLQLMNAKGSTFSNEDLILLGNFPQLQKLYINSTAVDSTALDAYKGQNSGIEIIHGNFILTPTVRDSLVFKYQK